MPMTASSNAGATNCYTCFCPSSDSEVSQDILSLSLASHLLPDIASLPMPALSGSPLQVITLRITGVLRLRVLSATRP